MLMDQKQLCDCMIDDKNKLINDFNQVIKINYYLAACQFDILKKNLIDFLMF